MALDVSPPDPPTLQAVDPNEYEDATIDGDTDYRRDELQTALEDGAWVDAFEQWAASTDMDAATYAIATDLSYFADFDFFWDGFAGRVGYHAPGVPEDWQERTVHPDLDSWTTVSTINAELTTFGQVVCDVIEEEYVDWEQDYEAPDDLPDFD
jgi:transcription elongation factor